MTIRRSHVALLLAGLGAVLTVTPPVGAAGLDAFGRCLKDRGATFYGASWCPHCAAQRQTLGDAMSHVRYVECSEDGNRGAPARTCKAANVSSYPTWVFADGSRESGEQSLEALASRTGCPLPRR